jgi:hypothetical protein
LEGTLGLLVGVLLIHRLSCLANIVPEDENLADIVPVGGIAGLYDKKGTSRWPMGFIMSDRPTSKQQVIQTHFPLLSWSSVIPSEVLGMLCALKPLRDTLNFCMLLSCALIAA